MPENGASEDAMYSGARITDAVSFHRQRGDIRRAVISVRERLPERLRWRQAVGQMTVVAGQVAGRERMRIEEPIREVVVDLPDVKLKREVVLDARKVGVDFDRGEVLPRWVTADLRRMAYMVGVDLQTVQRWVPISVEFDAPIDTAAFVIVGRTLAEHHRRRAQKLWLQIPDADGPEPMRLHHQYMAERADRDADTSRRWAALAKTLCEGSG